MLGRRWAVQDPLQPFKLKTQRGGCGIAKFTTPHCRGQTARALCHTLQSWFCCSCCVTMEKSLHPYSLAHCGLVNGTRSWVMNGYGRMEDLPKDLKLSGGRGKMGQIRLTQRTPLPLLTNICWVPRMPPVGYYNHLTLLCPFTCEFWVCHRISYSKAFPSCMHIL